MTHGTPFQGLAPRVRALLVMLQGIWFIQIAQILYTGELCGPILSSFTAQGWVQTALLSCPCLCLRFTLQCIATVPKYACCLSCIAKVCQCADSARLQRLHISVDMLVVLRRGCGVGPQLSWVHNDGASCVCDMAHDCLGDCARLLCDSLCSYVTSQSSVPLQPCKA